MLRINCYSKNLAHSSSEMPGLEKRKNCLLNGLLDSYVLRPVYKKVIGTFSRHKNVKQKVVFAVVALPRQLPAGVAFLEDFALEGKAMTLVFQLCTEVHGSSCTKQEVHYVMTWTKQPRILQKQFLASVKSKNIPHTETSSNVVRAWRNRACNVQMQQLSLRPRGGIGSNTSHSKRPEEQPEQVCKIYACKFPCLSHLESEQLREVCSIPPSSQVRCSGWILRLPLGTGPRLLPV